MYDLVKLHSNIEFFKFKSIKFENDIEFVYLFNGQEILVYEVSELIEKSYNDNDREENLKMYWSLKKKKRKIYYRYVFILMECNHLNLMLFSIINH